MESEEARPSGPGLGARDAAERSSSSSFEDLASAEVEEARLAIHHTQQLDEQAAGDEWQDILGSGDLLKKILVKGVEEEEDQEGLRPQRGDSCRVTYTIKLPDEPTCIEQREHVDIFLGDNELLQGMDLALSLMYKGEKCLLRIAPRFGYGESGLKPGEALGSVHAAHGEGDTYEGAPVDADAWLEATLELHDWTEEPEHDTLTFAQRMELGGRRRARGNWWYGRGDVQLATQLYRRALDALDESAGGISDPTPSGQLAPTSDHLQALLEERLRVHNNMAAAQLRAGAYDAALQAVTRVLTCQPNNVKALFRKARVLTAMGRTNEALEAARAAAAASPQDAAARRELQRCEAAATRDRSAERRLARRMLGASADPAKEPRPPGSPSTAKLMLWGSLLLSLMVGVAGVIAYRYRTQAQ